MKPYLSAPEFDLWHGDCIEVMRTLPDASVDSVVTDPPYGLEFMGKDWDAPWKASGDVIADPASVGGFQDGNGGNPYSRSRIRYGREGDASIGFQEWCELWATECFRVLKPGGHLLAFGGTRTWHRLAVAIEDAGFDIRDSIAWMYGSGFPKSLDVSKAIDKNNGEAGRLWKFTAFMRSTGLTAKQLNEVTDTFMGGHYLTDKSQPAIPTPELWQMIRPSCGDVPEWVDDLVARIAAEREVVGSDTKARSTSGNSALPTLGGETVYQTWDITAPATDAANQWQGWGTALKPAFEPIVVARKPLSTAGINVLKMVESELKERGVEGEITWTSAHASDAGKLVEQKNLSSIAVPQVEETSVAHAGANETLRSDWPTANYSARSTQSGERIIPNSSKQPAVEVTDDSESKFLTTMAESAPAAENQSLNFLPLTTLTEAGQHTASQFTEKFTPNFDAKDSLPVIASFAGIATGLTGSRALVRIDQLSDGSFIWPKSLPRSFSTPLTVAENVLAHGTGALNIDRCRIPSDDGFEKAWDKLVSTNIGAGEYVNTRTRQVIDLSANKPTGGRWPANVILDESQAAELDKQSGVTTAGAAGKKGSGGFVNGYDGEYDVPYGDTGGASRFFYTAKANSAERPKDGDVAHPTVKPLDLMRYLVRLVTPPGGTVLEPFGGSGTTIEACVIEGFRCIAIELTEEYLTLIAQRLTKPIQITLL